MKRASDLACHIVALIDSATWSEGERVPAERALCVQFGSARNTVRKALDQLERGARITRRGKRGFIIRDGREIILPHGADRDGRGMVAAAATPEIPLPQSDFMTDIASASPADIMELRLIVEPMAAALAAVRATLPDIEEIAGAALATEAATSVAEREEADAAFHANLFSATRNPLLLSLCNAISGVREHAQWFERKRKVLTAERRGVYDRQHAEILGAVRRRDGNEASALMRIHLETLRQDLLGVSALS